MKILTSKEVTEMTFWINKDFYLTVGFRNWK